MKLAHPVSLAATFIALGLSLQPPAVTSQPLAETHPNVVVILTDDQDVDSLPVMRHLMSYPEGSWVQFSQAITNVALCSPSRATLLTGQYAHHHTIASNHTTTFDDTNTLAVWLDDAGYETAIIGKYLNWAQADALTPGWDHVYDTKMGAQRVETIRTKPSLS